MENFPEYSPYVALGLSALAVVISALTALFSWLAHKRDHKLNKDQFSKIKKDSEKAYDLAVKPSWFAERMTTDEFFFGLVTNQGQIIAINKINSISDDGKWLEVTLLTHDELPDIKESIPHNIRCLTAVADDRRTASVLVSNIVLALEIASS